MSSITRLTLLGLFGAVGIGAAICVALVTDPTLAGFTGEDSRATASASIPGDRPDGPRLRRQEPAPLERSRQDAPVDWEPPAPVLVAAQPKHAQETSTSPRSAETVQGELVLQAMRAALEAQASAFQQREAGPVARLAQQPAAPSGDATFKDEGDDQISLECDAADVRKVLEQLAEQIGINVLVSKSVEGTVSLTLNNVSVETAIQGVLNASGYEARRQDNVIYVGTAADIARLEAADDPIGTRIYQPNYVRAAELKLLLTPFLTSETGKIEVSSPALAGIGTDSSTVEGDNYAGPDIVIVRDRESVLDQLDQMVARVDRRPLQVAIEAMIMSVKLDDEHQFGVNFELLKDRSNSRLISGTPPSSLASISASSAGLNFGFLDSSITAFVTALEEIGDTNVIATPRILCLNKHRAEIHIGSELGYVSTSQTETSTVQSVDFLEVGTQLRIRPFISRDGMIRMEIHPELSTGSVTEQAGFTIPNKEVTQVTTNVMARDGATIVIGGLISESLTMSNSQIPLLGSLPLIGPLFRQQKETTTRTELIILITARIVYDDVYDEGHQAASEFHRRQAVFANHMNPTGKRYLGKMAFRKAQDAWATADRDGALQQISRSIAFDPLNRSAIRLREDVLAGDYYGGHTVVPPLATAAMSADGLEMSPWLLNELRGNAVMPYAGPHPRDPGTPGPHWNIERGRGR